ncbi:hypothetical protein G7067_08230 [Leucobacter insecticola]|uniref:Uncharacterized protein n=1 Tax=Leucobacter insecticola TaxID=2714934 RepID=A0A6G8FJ83_9MICO|nr:hypothetical protein [Leucobacter insecticola]QIM16411.1 hypothetical protein G7067_08230 [Leucobacter insecticola]
MLGDDDTNDLHGVKAVLTEEATATFRDLVRASLTECLASTALTTPCGNDLSDLRAIAKPIDGTVQRKLTTEGDAALNALTPESSYTTPSVVSSYDVIRIDVTYEFEKAGKREKAQTMFVSLLTPYVDFSKEPLEVTWE